MHTIKVLVLMNSIKTTDFSTIPTTIPQSRLKNRLKELANFCFMKGQETTCLSNEKKTYFVKKKPTPILSHSSLKLIS